MAALRGKAVIAAYCGVVPRTIDNWRRHRGFPAITIGHGPMQRILTTTDAITHWLSVTGMLEQTARDHATQTQSLGQDTTLAGTKANAA